MKGPLLGEWQMHEIQTNTMQLFKRMCLLNHIYGGTCKKILSIDASGKRGWAIIRQIGGLGYREGSQSKHYLPFIPSNLVHVHDLPSKIAIKTFSFPSFKII